MVWTQCHSLRKSFLSPPQFHYASDQTNLSVHFEQRAGDAIGNEILPLKAFYLQWRSCVPTIQNLWHVGPNRDAFVLHFVQM